MVTFRETRPKRNGIGRFFGRLSEIVTEARLDYARWCLYRDTKKELQALGAEDRATLGLTRRSIRRLARRAVYRQGT